jgi:peptide deformylase
MAVRPLTYFDNPILRQKAKRVARFDGSLQKLIDDMVETMHAEHGVGLAAPQVGVSLRLCVIQLPEDHDDPRAGELIVLANPEVVKGAEEYEVEEGCLSIPGYVGDNIRRAAAVTVKGRDAKGKEIRVHAEGWYARVLQHEIDHLDGILFTDRLDRPEDLREVTEEEAAQDAEGQPAPGEQVRVAPRSTGPRPQPARQKASAG